MMMESQDIQPYSSKLTYSRTSSNSSGSNDLMPKVPLAMTQSLLKQKREEKKSSKIRDFLSQLISSEKNCVICMSKKENPCSLAECHHDFCSECIVSYLTYKINSMQEIICPQEGCDKKLELNSQAYKNLPQNYQQKFKKQQLWQQTMKNPDLRLCPIQNCKEGTVNMTKNPPKCNKCDIAFCKQCMMKQHAGQGCDQNLKKNFKEWKRCPKCLIFIQKTFGCNHMVCRCKNEFCFICLSVWSNQHYSCVPIGTTFARTIVTQQSNLQRIFRNFENVRYPRLLVLGLILLIPFFIVIGLGFLVLGSVFMAIYFILFIVFLQFIDRYINNNNQQFDKCYCFIVITLLPLVIVAAAIIGFIAGFFKKILPLAKQFTRRYFNLIKDLCSSLQQET